MAVIKHWDQGNLQKEEFVPRERVHHGREVGAHGGWGSKLGAHIFSREQEADRAN